MPKKDIAKVLLFLGLIAFAIAFVYYNNKRKQMRMKVNPFNEQELVKIPSSFDSTVQLAYFHKAKAAGRPFLISLHTWGGTYKQADSLYDFAVASDWNYIHPDYRGAQWNPNSCCFDPAIKDIDDAIAYGIKTSNPDTSKLFLVGKSGGGSGVLAAFLKSDYRNLKCYAWAPIADYVQWHDDVLKDTALKRQYYEKILWGTNSKGSLNVEQARLKSPQYFEVQVQDCYSGSYLKIYTGIMDGIKGSTSILQPTRFYNKVLAAWNVSDSSGYFTGDEINYLYDKRSSIRNFDQTLGNRKVIHRENHANIELTVFDGAHEILLPFMISELKRSDSNK